MGWKEQLNSAGGNLLGGDSLMSPMLERAWRVAGQAHEGQRRKASGLAYLVHPTAVSLILARAGFLSDEVLAAAVLHDVVEDTEWTLETLQESFPASVVELVDAASERKRDEQGRKLPWRERKVEHIARIIGQCLEARAIVLADKLHNLTATVFDSQGGERIWDRFNAGRDDVLWYYDAIVDAAGGAESESAGLVLLRDQCHLLVARIKSIA